MCITKVLQAQISDLASLPIVHGMATGSNKSLRMFLVPLAVSDSAVAITISPLNGLMDKQV